MKVLVVGSGISGLVAARMMHDAGHSVRIMDTRQEIGGNCVDALDAVTGVRVHKYGPHCFHTNSPPIWEFMNRFASFNDFKAQVIGRVSSGALIPVPFNQRSAEIVGACTSEQIRDMVFVDYSEKMWGRSWLEIPKAITNRLPTMREDTIPEFHRTKWQGVPYGGYAAMLAAMGDGIDVELGVDKDRWRAKQHHYDLMVYCGKLDAYFGYEHGRLPYRSLDIRFEYAHRQQECFQINECNSFNKWTRQVDHTYFEGVTETKKPGVRGVLSQEWPTAYVEGENVPFYPMKNFANVNEPFGLYEQMADQESNVLFLGRLATYSYIDMDVAVGLAMQKVKHYV